MKKNNIIKAVVIGLLTVVITFFFVYTIVDLTAYTRTTGTTIKYTETSTEVTADNAESSNNFNNYPSDATKLMQGVYVIDFDSHTIKEGFFEFPIEGGPQGWTFYCSGAMELIGPDIPPISGPHYAGNFKAVFTLGYNSITLEITELEKSAPLITLHCLITGNSYKWTTPAQGVKLIDLYIYSVSYIELTETQHFSEFFNVWRTVITYETYSAPSLDFDSNAGGTILPALSLEVTLNDNNAVLKFTSTSSASGYYHIFKNGVEFENTHSNNFSQGIEITVSDEGVYSAYTTTGQDLSFMTQGYYYFQLPKGSYEDGYTDGYNEGENHGYNNGYTDGYDSGASSTLLNPISIFIEPVDNFLGVDIFGTVSIGDILSVILFVLVALIFVKMFAGG